MKSNHPVETFQGLIQGVHDRLRVISLAKYDLHLFIISFIGTIQGWDAIIENISAPKDLVETLEQFYPDGFLRGIT